MKNKEREQEKTINQNDPQILISFIQATKDGKFIPIDKDSIYPRMDEQAETYYEEEEYFYSVR